MAFLLATSRCKALLYEIEVTSDNNVTVYHKNLSAMTVDLGLGVLSVCGDNLIQLLRGFISR